MKLWGGRFTKETDQLVQNFNESLSFDQIKLSFLQRAKKSEL